MKSENQNKAFSRFAAVAATACLALTLTPAVATADTGDDVDAATVTSVTLNGDHYEWAVTINGVDLKGTAAKIVRNADGSISPSAVVVTESSNADFLAEGNYEATFEGTAGARDWSLTAEGATAPALTGVVSATAEGDDVYSNVSVTELKDAAGTEIPASEVQASVTSYDENGNAGNTVEVPVTVNGQTVYRVYNELSGEHVFTSVVREYNYLSNNGWVDEGVAWTSPTADNGARIYRLYNPNAPYGDHHYTTDEREANYLQTVGWSLDESTFYASKDTTGAQVYRLYNPNGDEAYHYGRHQYTTSAREYNYLKGIGWTDESDNGFYVAYAPVEAE